MKYLAGFTLIEVMIVVLIVSVLAAASTPMLRGRIDDAKWAEANAIAGAIRRAERLYFLETGETVIGRMNRKKKREALGLELSDLTGSYFVAKDFRIMKVDENGIATIRVRGSQSNAPNGQRILQENGNWE